MLERDPDTVAEALQLLEAGVTSRVWYVLEGESQPDACLETHTVLLVVEGKRTERGATTVTTWMQDRSQILRHMDAAWGVAAGKRVLGLMIVEGEGEAEATAPSAYWLSEAEAQTPNLASNGWSHEHSRIERR